VDFKNTIIIMTSNVGAKMIQKRTHLGFHQTSGEHQHQQMKERVTGELKRVFNPEFLNRVDEVITFHELTETDILSIVNIMIGEINRQLAERELRLTLTDEARTWLTKKGYDPVYGARPLRRLIQRSIEDMLAEEMLRGHLEEAETIRIIVQDDETLGYELIYEEDFELSELAIS
jgi:ATP-dependent Clp protease ATP-binding subunit ClpC